MGPWERQDIELLTLEWNGGGTLEAIALRLDRTYGDITSKAEELGLKCYKSEQQDDGEEE